MLGESLAAAMISDRGLVGDRTHALLDVASGRIASAKKPALWRKLLHCAAMRRAGSNDTGIEIRFPNGDILADDDAELDAKLSELLGRQVELISRVPNLAEIERAEPDEVLARGLTDDVPTRVLQLAAAAPPGTFVDFASVHVIASATLAQISRSAGECIEPLRYRPNVIIDTPDLEPFAENAWVGRTLMLGTTVQLQVVFLATPRCAVPTLSHGELPARPEALRTVTRLNRVEFQEGVKLPCVGVHARVLRGGVIAGRDEVALISLC